MSALSDSDDDSTLPPAAAAAGTPPRNSPRSSSSNNNNNLLEDDDDEDASLASSMAVPPTPQAPTRTLDAPGTPLTPLSTYGDDASQEQQEQQQAPPNNASNNNNVDVQLLDQGEVAHVRGTDVNIPTAAAAFVDFLRRFQSLEHARQRQSRRRRRRRSDSDDDNDHEDDDDEDDDNMSVLSGEDDEDSTNRTPPLYLTRLRNLLTHGTMFVDQHDATAAASSSSTVPCLTTSLEVDTMHLYYHSAECQRLYHQLIAYPMEIVPLMDIVVQRELEALSLQLDRNNNNNTDAADEEEERTLPRVQVRPFNLKHVSNLRCLDPVAMDTLISIKGMIVRSSPIIPDLKIAHFGCTICGHSMQVTIDRGRIAEPHDRCPQCNIANSFALTHNRSIFNDKQLVRVQETPDEVPAGQTPASVATFCFDDLVDSVQPGDRMEATGILRAQPARVNPKMSKCKTVYKTYVDVIHFRKITGMEITTAADKNVDLSKQGGKGHWTAERIQELVDLSKDPGIYDKLTQSLAPSIWEMDNVKKGVLCMLFGGNHVRIKRGTAQREQDAANNDDQSKDSWLDDDEDDNGNGQSDDTGGKQTLNKRGDINVLLVGDPGTSKSQLLTYVNKLSSRGVYTSGKGSSAVGLTASVVRDPETRDLVLESGALVLSDLGICCIDEFVSFERVMLCLSCLGKTSLTIIWFPLHLG
jgi:DNA replication licensing factor MCM4